MAPGRVRSVGGQEVTPLSTLTSGVASPFWGHLNNTGRYDFRIASRKPILEAGAGHERLCPPGMSVTCSNDPADKPDVIADLFRLPFADRSFGLTIAHEVFCTYEASQQLQLLAELWRVSDSVYFRQWKACGWPGCGFKFGESPPFQRKT